MRLRLLMLRARLTCRLRGHRTEWAYDEDGMPMELFCVRCLATLMEMDTGQRLRLYEIAQTVANEQECDLQQAQAAVARVWTSTHDLMLASERDDTFRDLPR